MPFQEDSIPLVGIAGQNQDLLTDSHFSPSYTHDATLRRHAMKDQIFHRHVFAAIRRFPAVFAVLLIIASLGLAQPPQSQDKYSQEDKRTLETYVLSIDKVNMVTVAGKVLQEVEASDASVEKLLQHISGETLDQTFKRVDSNSKAAGAIHSSGLTTRDYWLTAGCAATANVVSTMITNGLPMETLEQMFPWKPSTEQLAFVKAHQAEMEQWMAIKKK
jgi:hypothetical protein